MKRVLMLAVRMSLGHGVSVVIAELCKRLQSRGVGVVVGCLEHDGVFSDGTRIEHIPASPQEIQEFCAREDIGLVIAHTSPYFEVLPELDRSVKRFAWEHGDPTPELFVFDVEERRRIIEHKRRRVYPLVDQVIAISNFVRSEIGWPLSMVIYNGCDHLPLHSPKKNLTKPLRIGFLTRMGKGERFYKGGELIVELADRLSDKSESIKLEIMGRGEKEDGEEFQRAGLIVHLNATDAERSRFLSEIDVFVSLSLWEGFNLPLVEGQVSGALGVALDVGAHPEVTAYLCAGITELEMFIRQLQDDRELLYELSVLGQRDCMERFRWDAAIDQLIDLAA